MYAYIDMHTCSICAYIYTTPVRNHMRDLNHSCVTHDPSIRTNHTGYVNNTLCAHKKTLQTYMKKHLPIKKKKKTFTPAYSESDEHP